MRDEITQSLMGGYFSEVGHATKSATAKVLSIMKWQEYIIVLLWANRCQIVHLVKDLNILYAMTSFQIEH